jgi:Cu/Ag efflux protein CusF
MKKKVKYLMVTCLTIALLSFGVVAFANGGTSANSDNIKHEAVVGKFVALENKNSKIKVSLVSGTETYSLEKTAWVLRDKQKAALENLQIGDKLEFVFNSNNKVAYIKAYSEVYLKAQAAALLATPAPTLAPIATVNPTPTATPSPTATPNTIKSINNALEDDKDKADDDGKFDDKFDGEDNGKHKGKDHHEDNNGNHYGWDKHDMKKRS